MTPVDLTSRKTSFKPSSAEACKSAVLCKKQWNNPELVVSNAQQTQGKQFPSTSEFGAYVALS